jgi:hypothetical protein
MEIARGLAAVSPCETATTSLTSSFPPPAIRLLPRANRQLLNRVRSESQFFLFAAETVSSTIPCEAYMARGIAMITGTCRQPGDGAGSSAYTVTRAKLTGNS